MEDWGSLFQELVAAPQVDHVTGLDEQARKLNKAIQETRVLGEIWEVGRDVIGLDRCSATLRGGTGPGELAESPHTTHRHRCNWRRR